MIRETLAMGRQAIALRRELEARLALLAEAEAEAESAADLVPSSDWRRRAEAAAEPSSQERREAA